MSKTGQPLVILYDSCGLGLIIKYPSGVLYSNQAGGYACMQPAEEGIYVPLSNDGFNLDQIFYKYFTGPKWMGGCANGIDDETADFIDEQLKTYLPASIIRVDRDRMKDSYEAWVYVRIAIQPDERPAYSITFEGSFTKSDKRFNSEAYDIDPSAYLFYGFGACEGVLTWFNSD
ncbi:MAG: hypothetical protein H6670_00310 [Anaerolineaceae bacterium]|nr:hypothetical protein [Anaerolineae bacterium]MCB9458059.1 hypothetical protein [Anaerolineaceae bacterium]